jgi:nucleoside-diphosphate-sugar epimerase
MKVLVTGGSGFVGAALCTDLVEQGHHVVAFDNNSRGHARRLAHLGDSIEFVQGDVRDFEQVRAATRGCEVVWHLAYVNGTRFFYERPDDVLEVGIKGALNTVEAALAEGVRRYVLASTSETYNQPYRIPTDETEMLKIPDVTNPRFSYGGGKIASELLALHLGAQRGLESVIFRPHNFYGPDMGVEHVVPEITRRIVQLSDGLTRDSIELPIQGDGSDTRAFCHVSDGAAGAIIAGDRGSNREIYNVGTEREVSVADLVTMIGRSLGVRVTLIPGHRPEGGTARRCPDMTKLGALGFEPKVGLEEGLAATTAWYADDLLGANIAEVARSA